MDITTGRAPPRSPGVFSKTEKKTRKRSLYPRSGHFTTKDVILGVCGRDPSDQDEDARQGGTLAHGATGRAGLGREARPPPPLFASSISVF